MPHRMACLGTIRLETFCAVHVCRYCSGTGKIGEVKAKVLPITGHEGPEVE